MTLCVLVIQMLLSAPAADAEEGGTSLRRSYSIAMSDWLLTIQARKQLWEDRELGRLNLAVVIENGVASLYGGVPSQYFQEHAEAVVMQVRGVLFVHNRLRVDDRGRSVGPKVRQFRSMDQAGSDLPGRQ
jgi:osmotically-inducible protein OsmY